MARVQLLEQGGSPHGELSAGDSQFSLHVGALPANHKAIISSFASENFARPRGAHSATTLLSPEGFSPGAGSYLTQQCHLKSVAEPHIRLEIREIQKTPPNV